MRFRSLLCLSTILIAAAAPAQQSPATGQGGAIGWPPMATSPAKFTPPTDRYDYVKREVMIPMRDGVKLHTVIVIPKGATDARSC